MSITDFKMNSSSAAPTRFSAAPVAAGIALLLMLAGCMPGAMFDLQSLEGQRMAVVTSAPPVDPIVYHERLSQVGVFPYAEDGREPRGYEETEVERAEQLEAVLREAMRDVNLVDSIGPRIGAFTANRLALQLTEDPEAADVLLDIRILDFGLTTGGLGQGATAFIDADIALLDAETRDVLWAFFPPEKSSRDISARRLFSVDEEYLQAVMEDHIDWIVERFERQLRSDS